MVSTLAAASRKWNGMKTLPGVTAGLRPRLQPDRAAPRPHRHVFAVGQPERRQVVGVDLDERPRLQGVERGGRAGSWCRCASAPAAGRC